MKTLNLTLPKPHSRQQQVVHEAQRYNVLACGRRFGKTTLGVELAVRPALETKPVGWFTPNYKLMIEVWRDMGRILNPVTKRSNATERRIELITGGVLEFWTLEDPDAGRSRKYKRVVIDEAGLVPTLGESWQAAIRPTLADLQGDAWFLGTPKGRNFFWECFQRGQDPLQPDWASWQMPTSANPFILHSEIEAMRAEMTERRFLQEIEAQFLEDAGGVFRNVQAAATLTSKDRPELGHQYVIGADWGKTDDYTVFVVIDISTGHMVTLDRSNRVDYALQRARLQALAERWRPVCIVAETNAMGEPIVEALQRDGMPVIAFQTTNASKAAIIDGLALAFERSSIRILTDPTLVAELQAYEATKTPSGLTRYGAPEGMHDDCVMALALAWWGASNGHVDYVPFRW